MGRNLESGSTGYRWEAMVMGIIVDVLLYRSC